MLGYFAIILAIVCDSLHPKISIPGSSEKGGNAGRLSLLQNDSFADNKSILSYGLTKEYRSNYIMENRNRSYSKSQDLDKTAASASSHIIRYKYSIHGRLTLFQREIIDTMLTLFIIMYVVTTLYKSVFVDGHARDKIEKECHKFDTDYGFYMKVPHQITVAMLPSFNTGAKRKDKCSMIIHSDTQVECEALKHSENSVGDTDKTNGSHQSDISSSLGFNRGATYVSAREDAEKDRICSRSENNTKQPSDLNGTPHFSRPLKGSNQTESVLEATGDSNRIDNIASSVQKQNTLYQNVDNPRYGETGVRFQTFENWPQKNVGNIRDISEAGFYYVGFGDSVRCFCCGGGYYNFKPTTDPYSEHFRLYPSCEFIKRKLEERSHGVGNSGATNIGMATTASSENKPGSFDEQPTANAMKSTLSHTDIKTLLVMGFKKKQIEDLICRQLSNDRKQENNDSILQLLMPKQPENCASNNDAKDKSCITTQGDQNATTSSPSGDMTTTADGNQDRKQTQGTKSSENSDTSSDEEVVQSMKDENRQLREHLLCKICLDKNSSVVFMNCGHMITCPECSQAIRKCPICRKLIRGRVQIH